MPNTLAPSARFIAFADAAPILLTDVEDLHDSDLDGLLRDRLPQDRRARAAPGAAVGRRRRGRCRRGPGPDGRAAGPGRTAGPRPRDAERLPRGSLTASVLRWCERVQGSAARGDEDAAVEDQGGAEDVAGDGRGQAGPPERWAAEP